MLDYKLDLKLEVMRLTVSAGWSLDLVKKAIAELPDCLLRDDFSPVCHGDVATDPDVAAYAAPNTPATVPTGD